MLRDVVSQYVAHTTQNDIYRLLPDDGGNIRSARGASLSSPDVAPPTEQIEFARASHLGASRTTRPIVLGLSGWCRKYSYRSWCEFTHILMLSCPRRELHLVRSLVRSPARPFRTKLLSLLRMVDKIFISIVVRVDPVGMLICPFRKPHSVSAIF